jgi:ferredoxin-type protein NapH
MAAVLGLIQKFGRFRITVKRTCASRACNCPTYCEMGIDVHAHAMATLERSRGRACSALRAERAASNQYVKRAACVGCGMCAHMCPRGALKLENRPARWKAGQAIRVYAVDL